MEFVFVLVALMCLTLLVGSILGIAAFVKINSLAAEINKLKLKLAQFMARQPSSDGIASANNQPNTNSEVSGFSEGSFEDPLSPRDNASTPEQTNSDQELTFDDLDTSHEEKSAPSNELTASKAVVSSAEAFDAKRQINEEIKAIESDSKQLKSEVSSASTFFDGLQENWMAWLGGFCIALAGIFFGKYSIEQGLLGPGMRIFLGCATGLALHAGAFWLRQRKGNHISLAAMAGGGSITLFATLLSALHFYQMFSPLIVFILLAVVALATMWLALIHGPALAVIGMLGAYTVPIMVSTGSGNLIGAMMYALIITVSVLLLVRAVKIQWLWWGALIGGLAWWTLSMTTSQPDGFRGIYLAVLAYCFLSIVSGNYRLTKVFSTAVWPFKNNSKNSNTAAQEEPVPLAIMLLVIAQVISILFVGWFDIWASFLALPAIVLFAARQQPRLVSIIWLSFIGTIAVILLPILSDSEVNFQITKVTSVDYSQLMISFLSLGVLYLVFSILNYRTNIMSNWWASLIALIPILLLLSIYILANPLTNSFNWSLLLVILGAVDIALAMYFISKNTNRWLSVWHLLAGHLSYSVAVYVMFENTTLTLALAAQIFSLAWIITRFSVSEISWLLKAVVTLVVVRLTLNPWLVDYPAADHWPLWTYGGATLICYLSSLRLKDFYKLRQWTEVAALHLLVLTLWTEARYLLHDGEVFKVFYGFNDMVLNCLLFGALSLVYYLKAQVSQTIKKWYFGYSYLLLALSGLNYLLVLTGFTKSQKWAIEAIGTQPIFNALIFALGLPIVLGYLIAKYHDKRLKLPADIFVGLASFIFVSFEIRHLWQQTVSLKTPTSDGELYSYSAVWLLMAIGTMVVGGWKQSQHTYRGGLIILSIVIFKIFIIDLAGLDGLFRVASFMGLGLALVGISFLHQKIKPIETGKQGKAMSN